MTLPSSNDRICPTCEGEGEVHFLRRPPDPQTEDWERCSTCHGTGVVPDESEQPYSRPNHWRLSLGDNAEAGATTWEIKVCDACDMPVESCRCDPEDFRDEAGELHEPSSRSVRVAPLEDERKAARETAAP